MRSSWLCSSFPLPIEMTEKLLASKCLTHLDWWVEGKSREQSAKPLWPWALPPFRLWLALAQFCFISLWRHMFSRVKKDLLGLFIASVNIWQVLCSCLLSSCPSLHFLWKCLIAQTPFPLQLGSFLTPWFLVASCDTTASTMQHCYSVVITWGLVSDSTKISILALGIYLTSLTLSFCSIKPA